MDLAGRRENDPVPSVVKCFHSHNFINMQIVCTVLIPFVNHVENLYPRHNGEQHL